MSTPEPDPALQQRAYALYWMSDDTVDQVAEQLGISRGSLYPLIRPWPVAMACPQCGGSLGFVNRTSRTVGRATCDACGFELEVDIESLEETGDEADAGPRRRRPRVIGRGEWSPRVEQWKDDIANVRPERAALIGGAAVLGVAIGAFAARMVRDRS